MKTVKTLAHVWATEEDAIQAQAQVDTSQNLPKPETTHYQTIQYQEGTGWWMMADAVTVSALGTAQLQVIDEVVTDVI